MHTIGTFIFNPGALPPCSKLVLNFSEYTQLGRWDRFGWGQSYTLELSVGSYGFSQLPKWQLSQRKLGLILRGRL